MTDRDSIIAEIAEKYSENFINFPSNIRDAIRAALADERLVPQLRPNEVLFAITQPEGYEGVHPDLLAQDCFNDFVEYRALSHVIEPPAGEPNG